jgi:hypothetical protein
MCIRNKATLIFSLFNRYSTHSGQSKYMERKKEIQALVKEISSKMQVSTKKWNKQTYTKNSGEKP